MCPERGCCTEACEGVSRERLHKSLQHISSTYSPLLSLEASFRLSSLPIFFVLAVSILYDSGCVWSMGREGAAQVRAKVFRDSVLTKPSNISPAHTLRFFPLKHRF